MKRSVPGGTGVARSWSRAWVRTRLGSLLLCTTAASAARAQEAAEPPDRWQAAAELAYTDASGNQELSVLVTELRLKHLAELFAAELKLEARYGSSEGERVAESYRGALQAELVPGSRWAPYVFTNAERDPFKRLDLRVNSGGGIKYRIGRPEDATEFAFSAAALHSYENLDDVGAAQHFARWSLRADARRLLREGVTLTHATQYQPVFDALDDYLLNVDTGLKVMLTRRVALSISHEYDRDATPAPGVGRDDRLLKTGILIEL